MSSHAMPPTKRGKWARDEKFETLTKVSYLPDISRLLPQSPEAEMGVLCSFFLSPMEMGAYLLERKFTAEHFHIPAHGTVFNAMMALYLAGTPIHFITLSEYLRNNKQFENVGGAGFVMTLGTFLATACNADYYVGICQEKHILREMIKVCTQSTGEAYDNQEEVPAVLDRFEQHALAVRASVERPSRVVPIIATVTKAIDNINLMISNGGRITGIETGFRSWDELLNGLNPGMHIVAARPSQGKTAFAMNVADHIAITLGLPVGIFSLEMSSEQLVERWISTRGAVNLQQLRTGFANERDVPAISKAAQEIANAPVFIDDSSDLTVQEYRGRIRRMVQQNGVRVGVIDYLQLMKSASKRAQGNEVQELNEVSGGIKASSKELNIPIIVLAQLGRDFEKRGPLTRPRLSDLKGSGNIEQDADSISFLTRPETYAETEQERRELAGIAELILAKQRLGPIGDVALTFIKEFTRFEERAMLPEKAMEDADRIAREQDARRQQDIGL